jgi:neutral ceramidase
MRDGSVRTNPGPLNPGIVEPAGGIDPALGIWQATEETGRTIAVVVNYALHAAVVTRGVSGDFPAVIERELRDVLGPDVQVLFLSGCCGDVNHTDVSVPGPRLGPTVAHDIGQRIACTVLDEIARSPEAVVGAKDPTALRISTRHVEVAFRSPPSANGRWGDAIPAAIEGVSESVSSRTTSDTGLVEVRRYRDWWLAKSARTADVVTVRSLICGDMALVTLPGEMFVQLGLDIRLASPFRNLLLATLNGSASYYVPPADAYAEGGYEVESTPLAPGGAEEIVRVVLDDLVAFSSGVSA